MALYDPAPQHWLSPAQLLAASVHHGINPEHVQNYVQLADYLTGLPEDYEAFGMDAYMRIPHSPFTGGAARQLMDVACGTVACAVGHGPTAGIQALKCEGWSEYTVRVFGGAVNVMNTHSPADRLATWCFDGAWSCFDDTHWGAAARIRAALQQPELVDRCAQLCSKNGNGDIPEAEEEALQGYLVELYAPQLAAVRAVAQSA